MQNIDDIFGDDCSRDEMHGRMLSCAIPVTRIADPKVRDCMKESGIIWGVDTAPGSTCMSMFHGMDMIHDLNEGRRAEWFPHQKIMFFSLDFRGDELEYLYAAVQHLHGRCCYNEH